MTRRIVAKVTKYYIAVQDGRFDDREYDTLAQAERARDALGPMLGLKESTCIMSRTYDEEKP